MENAKVTAKKSTKKQLGIRAQSPGWGDIIYPACVQRNTFGTSRRDPRVKSAGVGARRTGVRHDLSSASDGTLLRFQTLRKSRVNPENYEIRVRNPPITAKKSNVYSRISVDNDSIARADSAHLRSGASYCGISSRKDKAAIEKFDVRKTNAENRKCGIGAKICSCGVGKNNAFRNFHISARNCAVGERTSGERALKKFSVGFPNNSVDTKETGSNGNRYLGVGVETSRVSPENFFFDTKDSRTRGVKPGVKNGRPTVNSEKSDFFIKMASNVIEKCASSPRCSGVNFEKAGICNGRSSTPVERYGVHAGRVGVNVGDPVVSIKVLGNITEKLGSKRRVCSASSAGANHRKSIGKDRISSAGSSRSGVRARMFDVCPDKSILVDEPSEDINKSYRVPEKSAWYGVDIRKPNSFGGKPDISERRIDAASANNRKSMGRDRISSAGSSRPGIRARMFEVCPDKSIIVDEPSIDVNKYCSVPDKSAWYGVDVRKPNNFVKKTDIRGRRIDVSRKLEERGRKTGMCIRDSGVRATSNVATNHQCDEGCGVDTVRSIITPLVNVAKPGCGRVETLRCASRKISSGRSCSENIETQKTDSRNILNSRRGSRIDKNRTQGSAKSPTVGNHNVGTSSFIWEAGSHLSDVVKSAGHVDVAGVGALKSGVEAIRLGVAALKCGVTAVKSGVRAIRSGSRTIQLSDESVNSCTPATKCDFGAAISSDGAGRLKHGTKKSCVKARQNSAKDGKSSTDVGIFKLCQTMSGLECRSFRSRVKNSKVLKSSNVHPKSSFATTRRDMDATTTVIGTESTVVVKEIIDLQPEKPTDVARSNGSGIVYSGGSENFSSCSGNFCIGAETFAVNSKRNYVDGESPDVDDRGIDNIEMYSGANESCGDVAKSSTHNGDTSVVIKNTSETQRNEQAQEYCHDQSAVAVIGKSNVNVLESNMSVSTRIDSRDIYTPSFQNTTENFDVDTGIVFSSNQDSGKIVLRDRKLECGTKEKGIYVGELGNGGENFGLRVTKSDERVTRGIGDSTISAKNLLRTGSSDLCGSMVCQVKVGRTSFDTISRTFDCTSSSGVIRDGLRAHSYYKKPFHFSIPCLLDQGMLNCSSEKVTHVGEKSGNTPDSGPEDDCYSTQHKACGYTVQALRSAPSLYKKNNLYSFQTKRTPIKISKINTVSRGLQICGISPAASEFIGGNSGRSKLRKKLQRRQVSFSKERRHKILTILWKKSLPETKFKHVLSGGVSGKHQHVLTSVSGNRQKDVCPMLETTIHIPLPNLVQRIAHIDGEVADVKTGKRDYGASPGDLEVTRVKSQQSSLSSPTEKDITGNNRKLQQVDATERCCSARNLISSSSHINVSSHSREGGSTISTDKKSSQRPSSTRGRVEKGFISSPSIQFRLQCVPLSMQNHFY